MDINSNAEVKVVGIVPSPSVERDEKIQAQVKPVQESGNAGKTALDDKSLHRSPEQEKLTKEEMTEHLREIQKRLNLMGTRLGLDIEESAEVVVAKITDKDSGDLIKQIPSEEILALRDKIEDLIGILFDKQA